MQHTTSCGGSARLHHTQACRDPLQQLTRAISSFLNHVAASSGQCNRGLPLTRCFADASLLQVPIAVQVLLDPQVHSDTIYGHTQLSVLMCVISAGYFLHDLVIVLLRLETEGVAMLVHACCCLFVYGYAVYSFYLTFYGE